MKHIPFTNYRYMISIDGQVFDNNRNKLLKANVDSSGYLAVNILFSDGKRRKERIHRLVAMTYLPNWNKSLIVNHIDYNKLNNHVNNLELITHEENIQHAINGGKFFQRANHHLSIDNINHIKQLLTTDIPKAEIAKRFNISESTVYYIKNNGKWII